MLAAVLPSAHRAAHWDIAWAGFDIALALLLFAMAGARPDGAPPGSRARRPRPRRSCASMPGSMSSPLRLGPNSLSQSVKRPSSSCRSPDSVCSSLFLARKAERRLRLQLLNPSESAPPRLRLVAKQPAADSLDADRLSA